MAVSLNHTIVGAVEADTSARWLAGMLGLAEPQEVGYFWQVTMANDVALDFASVGDQPVVPQHYAFLLTEAEFDDIHGRLLVGEHDIWADPQQRYPGQVNHNDGGRGVYFLSNDGHFLEIITPALRQRSGARPPGLTSAAETAVRSDRGCGRR